MYILVKITNTGKDYTGKISGKDQIFRLQFFLLNSNAILKFLMNKITWQHGKR